MPNALELLPGEGRILVDIKSGTFKIGPKEYPQITRVLLSRDADGEYNLGISAGQGGGVCVRIDDPTTDRFSPVRDK